MDIADVYAGKYLSGYRPLRAMPIGVLRTVVQPVILFQEIVARVLTIGTATVTTAPAEIFVGLVPRFG